MTAGAYAAGLLGGSGSGERARLIGIQSAVDAFTTSVLDGLDPRPGWRCLEIGAGEGSIARWLARRCPEGSVDAVDVDLGMLDTGGLANLRPVLADVTDETFAPSTYDLVHARFVLCHLPGRERVLERAVSWLRPGGWLVVADPYQLPAEDSPRPEVRRILRAYADMHAAQGTDLGWVRRVPSLLAGSGLTGVEFATRPGCLGNGAQDRWGTLVDRVAPAMLAEGRVTHDDLIRFAELLADPAVVDVPQVTLAVWGRRPTT